METLFSTDHVHPRERFAYWHEVACNTLVNHESKPHSNQAFHAHIEAGSVADIGLVRFETSDLHVHRTQRHIAFADSDELFLCRQLAGNLAVEQLTRRVELTPGSMTLLDPLVPYAAQFSSGSKLLVLKLNRRDLEARIGKGTQMVARDLNCRQAECRLTSAFLALLPEHAERMSAASQGLVQHQTLDLIATSLGAAVNDHVKLASSKLVVLQRITAAIETNLSNPNLHATAVAAAAGVSIRYANAVLAGQGTSITALIRSLRLTRCRTALRDPMQERRKISEIAYGWGFCDMTNFCRAFKAAYGMTPSECRRSDLNV